MGDIVTFYSYKGGTGRSMALANVAWILASNDKRVLVVDWDLEAPGLHRYFRPFLLDKDLTGPSSRGLIEFIRDYAIEAATPNPDPERAPGWYADRANILRYATSLDWNFGPRGSIDFVPAGRQGPGYATLVNSFNWPNFYERLGGGTFLRAARTLMKEQYDYVLIDSRTGVSDTSGICTVVMPDVLVVCFTLNNQGIEGAAGIAVSAATQLVEGPDRAAVRIVAVPTRIDTFEKRKLQQRKSYARERFGSIAGNPASLNEVEIPYEPYYSYEETLATFEDEPGSLHGVLASCERLTGRITDGAIARLVPPSEAERTAVLAAFEEVTHVESVADPTVPARRGLLIRAAAAVAVLVMVVAGLAWGARDIARSATTSRGDALLALAQNVGDLRLAALLLFEIVDQPAPAGGAQLLSDIEAAGLPRVWIPRAAGLQKRGSAAYETLASSADGKRILIATDYNLSNSIQISDISIRSTQNGRLEDALSLRGTSLSFDESLKRGLVFRSAASLQSKSDGLQLIDLASHARGAIRDADAALSGNYQPAMRLAAQVSAVFVAWDTHFDRAVVDSAGQSLTLGPLLTVLSVPTNTGFRISPDQQAVATCRNDTCEWYELNDTGVARKPGVRVKTPLSQATDIVLGQRQVAVANSDGQIGIYDRSQGARLHTLSAAVPIEAMTLSSDGSLLAALGNGEVIVFNVSNGALQRKFRIGTTVNQGGLQFLGSTSDLAISTSDGIGIWSVSARPAGSGWSERLQSLRSMTTMCLSAADRTTMLRELAADAATGFQNCEIALGRPARVIDVPVQEREWKMVGDGPGSACAPAKTPVTLQGRADGAVLSVPSVAGSCCACGHAVREFATPLTLISDMTELSLSVSATLEANSTGSPSSALHIELLRNEEVVGDIWYARPPGSVSTAPDSSISSPRPAPPRTEQPRNEPEAAPRTTTASARPSAAPVCIPQRNERRLPDGDFSIPLSLAGRSKDFNKIRVHLYAATCKDTGTIELTRMQLVYAPGIAGRS